jgi:ribosome-associated protein
VDASVDALRPARGISIPVSQVHWRFDTAGGPGGQHANKAATRAEATLVLDEVVGADGRTLRRWRERFGPVVRVSVGRSRSQARNRELALEELERKLAGALRTEKTRRATSPTRGSQRRRLDAKRRRSEKKAQRRRPRYDD